MLCPWCGMESKTTDRCSWCHRSFALAPADAKETEEETSEAELPVEAASAATASGEIPLAALEEPAAPPQEEPKAPWTLAPPAPVADPSTQANAQGGRPVIGIKRVNGASNAPRRPAPPVPRREGTGGARHTPAPPMPAPHQTAVPPPSTAPPSMAQNTASTETRPTSTSPIGVRPTTPPARTTPETAAPSEGGGLADGVAKPPPPAQVAAELRVPQLGTFQPVKSKYYTDQVIDPISGTHYDANTGRPTSVAEAPAPTVGADEKERRLREKSEQIKIEWVQTEQSQKFLLARYLAVAAVILALTGVAARLLPAQYVIPLVISQFVLALLMPVMRVAPWADEDADDSWFLLGAILVGGLFMVCGPVIALIAYGVLALLRREANPAVLGCLLIAVACRLMVESATGALNLDLFKPFTFKDNLARPLLINWSALSAVAGWFTANIFHKFDE